VFDDVRGELRYVAATDMPHRVRRSGGVNPTLAASSVTGGLPSSRRAGLDDLFARMRVLGDPPLPGSAEIVTDP
jgi:hypothetical protein